MSASPNAISVSVAPSAGLIKIEGRANFSSSVDFKAVINGLAERGIDHFILDLTRCVLMDSTFLGVMAGLGMKFNGSRNGEKATTIELLNPSNRISDLLENLGVAHLFKVICGPELEGNGLAPLEQSKNAPNRKEISRHCLDAHRTLMEINHENIEKFKDVAQFLAEDLKKEE